MTEQAKPPVSLGVPASYTFGRWVERVRFIRVTRDGAAVIAHDDGRLDAVELHRVKLTRDVP